MSVSESHSQENTSLSVKASLEELRGIAELARTSGVTLEVTLATAFGCPFEGPVDPRAVLELARQAKQTGVDRFTLADTIGTAVPTEVTALVAGTLETVHPAELGAHLHDTRGLAIANALAAIEAGVDRLDGTVGGLGGCPFAPGASGNLALEDLVHVLEAMGVGTGIDLNVLLEASALACQLVGRRPASHVAVAGPRFVGSAMAGPN
jgi:hydroxymethylglutaryl-CoA lyase